MGEMREYHFAVRKKKDNGENSENQHTLSEMSFFGGLMGNSAV